MLRLLLHGLSPLWIKSVADDCRGQIAEIDALPVIPFTRMAEWGPDGRIKPDAPVYSPYVRRRKNLELE